MNDTVENIERVKIYYCVDVKNAIRNKVEIEINQDNPCIYYTDKVKNTEHVFKISDVDRIVSFIKENILKSDSMKENYIEQGQSEEQLILWDLDVNTNIKTYNYEGFEKFPTYWDQLWDVLVSVSDAKDKTDFGLQDTNSVENEETWNSSEEGETLCYEKYSDEQFDEMEKHFENIMSEEMLAYYKEDGSGWIAPSEWECLLLGEMELNPSVDNEIYSVEPVKYECHKKDSDVLIYCPHIEIKGNKDATDVANEEIKKFVAGNYYGMSEEEFLSVKNPTLNGDWFSYYTIGYMDDKMICIIYRNAMRGIDGININVETGKIMKLEEMGVTNEMLLEALERTPDHIVSGLYKKASKDSMRKAIEEGWIAEYIQCSFIIGKRLYISTSEGRGMDVYFGYDGILGE